MQASVEDLQRDSITGLKGAFPREWAEVTREDMMTDFWSAIQRPGGAVGRGPRRWYVEIHPRDFTGFVDLVTHPWVAGICEAVLALGVDAPTAILAGREASQPLQVDRLERACDHRLRGVEVVVQSGEQLLSVYGAHISA